MELSDLLAPLDWGRQGLTNTGEGLSGILGGDFSRNNFAKIMPGVAGLGAGLLTGGTMAAPVGALAMALTQGIGKQFNPTAMKALSTQDLLGKVGGDPDSTIQNIGMGLATDPFSYAGLSMASRLGNGAEAANLASAASKGGTAGTALEGGIGGTGAIGSPGIGEAAGGGRIGEMLGLRRGVGKVGFDPFKGELTARAGRFMGDPELDALAEHLGNGWEPNLHGISERSPMGGQYVGLLDTEGLDPALARATRRHEMYHGMLGQAVDTGETAGLTPLQKATHSLYTSASGPVGSSPRRGLAMLLDETGAHAAEQTSPLQQALSGGRFLFGNHGARAGYSAQLAEQSPTIGKLFDALGYAPQAAKYGGIGAGVGGASLASYGLGQQLFGR